MALQASLLLLEVISTVTHASSGENRKEKTGATVSEDNLEIPTKLNILKAHLLFVPAPVPLTSHPSGICV